MNFLISYIIINCFLQKVTSQYDYSYQPYYQLAAPPAYYSMPSYEKICQNCEDQTTRTKRRHHSKQCDDEGSRAETEETEECNCSCTECHNPKSCCVKECEQCSAVGGYSNFVVIPFIMPYLYNQKTTEKNTLTTEEEKITEITSKNIIEIETPKIPSREPNFPTIKIDKIKTPKTPLRDINIPKKNNTNGTNSHNKESNQTIKMLLLDLSTNTPETEFTANTPETETTNLKTTKKTILKANVPEITTDTEIETLSDLNATETESTTITTEIITETEIETLSESPVTELIITNETEYETVTEITVEEEQETTIKLRLTTKRKRTAEKVKIKKPKKKTKTIPTKMATEPLTEKSTTPSTAPTEPTFAFDPDELVNDNVVFGTRNRDTPAIPGKRQKYIVTSMKRIKENFLPKYGIVPIPGELVDRLLSKIKAIKERHRHRSLPSIAYFPNNK